MPIALIALTLSAFAIGTTEFVTVGLVSTISHDLNISIPSTGLLVTMYAFGVALGAPILTALTSSIEKKYVLIGAMIVFTLGHIVAGFTPGFYTLLGARIVTGLTHGLFFSLGATIATSLVPKDKAASAIAIMFGGLTVAMVTGVPMGTYIGQEYGWRNTFLLISLLGLIAFIGVSFLIPKTNAKKEKQSFFTQLKILANPKLFIAYIVTILGFGGFFITFTYLVPILQDITQFDPTIISTLLLVFGISTVVGNFLGGKLADKFGSDIVLYSFFFCLSITLISLHFFAMNQYITIGILILWGIFAFGTVPALQVHVVNVATIHEPQSVDVASGFNISAFNVGIALGSSIGGLIVARLGLLQTTWIAGFIVLTSLIFIYISYRLNKTI